MTPRILIWDIEATNLNANFGFILCIGYKWLGEKKTHIISIDDFSLYKKDPTNDKEILEAFGDVFLEADLHVAHFGQYFDFPYINTRRMYHNLQPLPKTRLIDTWRLAKTNLKLNSNRLATVAEFFDLGEKTPVTGPHWIKAMAGNTKSLKYVKQHCKIDVQVLEDVYKLLSAFQPAFPVYCDGNSCPHCNSERIQRRGRQFAKQRTYARYQCQACGRWSRGARTLT